MTVDTKGIWCLSTLVLKPVFFLSCRPPGEQQSGASAPAVRNLSATVSSTSSVSSGSSGLMRQNSNAAVGKPGPLPANLDEMKVNVL